MSHNKCSLLNSQWMIYEAGGHSLAAYFSSVLEKKPQTTSELALPISYMLYSESTNMYASAEETATNSRYIAVLSIKSPLIKYDFSSDVFSYPGTKSLAKTLKNFEGNDAIIGVVLDTDCPGGQVSGLSEFADCIAQFSKPIVTYTDGLLASAAYYVAAATDYIIANEHADFIGSIGTKISYVYNAGIDVAKGAVVKNIYATGSSRKDEEFRALIKTGSEDLILKNILNPQREKFVSAVKSFRNKVDESVFDGAVYNPTEALSLNLIDSFGTILSAFEKVVALSQSSKFINLKPQKNMTTKSLPKTESVLGLQAPLALTDNGSFLNENQLEAIEASLEESLDSIASFQSQLADSQTANTAAVDALQTELDTAKGSLSLFAADVDAILGMAGLEAQGTTAEKLAAIKATALAFGNSDGATHTNPKKDGQGSGSELDSLSMAGLDIVSALNN